MAAFFTCSWILSERTFTVHNKFHFGTRDCHSRRADMAPPAVLRHFSQSRDLRQAFDRCSEPTRRKFHRGLDRLSGRRPSVPRSTIVVRAFIADKSRSMEVNCVWSDVLPAHTTTRAPGRLEVLRSQPM